MPARIRATRAGGSPVDRLRRHRYGPLIEPLVDQPSLLVKSMFGCVACYVHGRLMLVLADRRPPWQGVLAPTSREHHGSLCAEIRALVVHPVLGKWLQVPEGVEDFEDAVGRLVGLAAAGDARLGVEPPARHPRPVRSGRRSRAS